jgi:MYND finger
MDMEVTPQLRKTIEEFQRPLKSTVKLCVCGESGTYKCSNCNIQIYCSKECQRRDHPFHKIPCDTHAIEGLPVIHVITNIVYSDDAIRSLREEQVLTPNVGDPIPAFVVETLSGNFQTEEIFGDMWRPNSVMVDRISNMYPHAEGAAMSFVEMIGHHGVNANVCYGWKLQRNNNFYKAVPYFVIKTNEGHVIDIQATMTGLPDPICFINAVVVDAMFDNEGFFPLPLIIFTKQPRFFQSTRSYVDITTLRPASVVNPAARPGPSSAWFMELQNIANAPGDTGEEGGAQEV